jgi:hypothetical protein
MNLPEDSDRVVEVLEHMRDGHEVEHAVGKIRLLRRSDENPAFRKSKKLTGPMGSCNTGLDAPRVPAQAGHLGKQSTGSAPNVEKLVSTGSRRRCRADRPEPKDVRQAYEISQQAANRPSLEIAS